MCLKRSKRKQVVCDGAPPVIIIWALPCSPFDLILMNSGPTKPELHRPLIQKLFICTLEVLM